MKKVQPLRIDKILIELLQKRPDIPFSTTEYRDLYLAQLSPDRRPDNNRLRKYIYKELLRLESASVITRHEGSTGRGCKFIYRSNDKKPPIKTKPSLFSTLNRHPESSTDLATHKALQEELSGRRVELIASIGEAEEYQRLYQKYPALRNAVKEQYVESRERSTKLLGQLRAVESVISIIKAPI